MYKCFAATMSALKFDSAIIRGDLIDSVYLPTSIDKKRPKKTVNDEF